MTDADLIAAPADGLDVDIEYHTPQGVIDNWRKQTKAELIGSLKAYYEGMAELQRQVAVASAHDLYAPGPSEGDDLDAFFAAFAKEPAAPAEGRRTVGVVYHNHHHRDRPGCDNRVVGECILEAFQPAAPAEGLDVVFCDHPRSARRGADR